MVPEDMAGVISKSAAGGGEKRMDEQRSTEQETAQAIEAVRFIQAPI